MVRLIARAALGVVLATMVAAATMRAQGQVPPAGEWRSANFDNSANRYSPLEQITPDNVTQLERAWSFHLKPAGYTGRPREDEAIPLVIGNTMYLASPYGAIHALDATTGVEKWKFALPNNEQPSKRGLAYWPGDGTAPASLIFGGLSGGMFSLKAADGTLNDGFGEHGVVNLKTPEGRQTGMNGVYSLLTAPTIYKNLIITGAGVGEGPAGSNGGSGPAGDTRAWYARTGRPVWTLHTGPRAGGGGAGAAGEGGCACERRGRGAGVGGVGVAGLRTGRPEGGPVRRGHDDEPERGRVVGRVRPRSDHLGGDRPEERRVPEVWHLPRGREIGRRSCGGSL